MRKQRSSRNSLFLVEIMLNLLFFVILITVCLQLFLKAQQLSKDTTLLHRAVTVCTSIAEVYQSGLDQADILQTIYPEALILNDTVLIYFDSSFTACSEFESVYRVFLSENIENRRMTIRFLRKNEPDVIYELETSSYSPLSLGELMGGVTP